MSRKITVVTERISRARFYLAESQQAVAARAGMDPRQYSCYESGTKLPSSPAVVQRLAAALGIDGGELMGLVMEVKRDRAVAAVGATAQKAG